jgi:chromate transporter
MVEAPGTAPGSEWFITTAIYRHSRQAGRPNIGTIGPRRKEPSKARPVPMPGAVWQCAARGANPLAMSDPESAPPRMSPAAPEPPSIPAGPAIPPPTIAELFLAFAGVSVTSFGGVLAWSRRMLVEDKRWMTAHEFNDVLALCQFLPGPNIVNVCAVFGVRMRGVPGALACLTGLVGPSIALMVVAGSLYRGFGALPELRGVLSGLAAAAAGMIIATAAQMAEPLRRFRPGPEHAVALAAFVAVGLLRLSLPLVLLVLVPISIGFAWRRVDEK